MALTRDKSSDESSHRSRHLAEGLLFFDQELQLRWQTTSSRARPDEVLAQLLLGPPAIDAPAARGLSSWLGGARLVQHARFELGLALRCEDRGIDASEHWVLVDALWTKLARSWRVSGWLVEQGRKSGLETLAASAAGGRVLRSVEDELLPGLHLRAAAGGAHRSALMNHAKHLLRRRPPRAIPPGLAGLWSDFLQAGPYRRADDVEAACVRAGMLASSLSEREAEDVLRAFAVGLETAQELPRREADRALPLVRRRLAAMPASASLCDRLAEGHRRRAGWRAQRKDDDGALRDACMALALDPHCEDARALAVQTATRLAPGRPPDFAVLSAGLGTRVHDRDVIPRLVPEARGLVQVRERAVISAITGVACARAVLDDRAKLVKTLCEMIADQKQRGSLAAQVGLLFTRQAMLDAPTLARALAEEQTIDPEAVYRAVRRAAPAPGAVVEPPAWPPPTVAAPPRAHAVRSWLTAPIHRGLKLLGLVGAALVCTQLPDALANRAQADYVARQAPLYEAALASRRAADDAALLVRARAFLLQGREADDPRIEQVREFLSEAVLGEVVRLVENGEETAAADLLELYSSEFDTNKAGAL